MSIILDILEDGVFAALAAIGFAAISNPPRMAFKYCALIAACGSLLPDEPAWTWHCVGKSFRGPCHRAHVDNHGSAS